MRSSPLILLALCASMACGPPAPTEPWVVFYRRGRVVASVDTSRVSRAERGQVLWLRFNAPPKRAPGNPGKTYTRTELLNHIDCAADSVNAMEMRMWDARGTLVYQTAREQGWRTISEHPLGRNGIYPALCRWLARRE